MSLCSSVNRGIYGHVAEVPGGGGEEGVYSSITRNRRVYSYIPRYREI
jgi:hypothetical protein